MPYEGEFASYRPLQRIAQSERVKALLGSYRVREWSATEASVTPTLLADLLPSDWAPDWILAIDGSHAEIPVKNGYPGAEAAYVTVASVLLDLAKLRSLDVRRPVDPKAFRTTQEAESIDCALPGCNIVFAGEPSPEASLRRAMFNILLSAQMSPGGETLLQTYEALLTYKPIAAHEQRCPYEDCQLPGGEYQRGKGQYSCTCPRRKPLYSTDALRIAEGMSPGGTNGAMFAEVMQVLERIWVVHVLRTLEANNWLTTLRRLAIVLDGPLAVFGHPAWLAPAIAQELMRINNKVRDALDGQDLLLVGVEKTGAFVDHFDLLDHDEHGSEGSFPLRGALLLDDGYIKRNIIPSDSAKPYGADTYFGRKFLYKTQSGARIVATLPFLGQTHLDRSLGTPAQYPRLADAMGLLDQLVSSRYPNALTPIVAAHAEAAIPLNLGRKVLERLAREMMSAGAS